MPLRIQGRWREGFALDWHTRTSRLLGYNEYGYPEFDTERSHVGELLYQLKYHGDQTAVEPLAEECAQFVRDWGPTIDSVVPVPASRERQVQPVRLVGRRLAEKLGLPIDDPIVRRIREVPELKNVWGYDERLRLLDGAHQIDEARARGRDVLLFDDLYRSGATMNTIASALYDRGGARNVYALTLTRTRSHQ